jgi:pimeloyl-ACP methyl ester carboxylesterase
MEYVVGAGLALGVAVFAGLAGFERDRAFYPAVLVVVASYYDLFAVMSGGEALGAETGAAAVFVCASVIGFRTNLWIVAAALAGHGVFDLAHGQLIENAGVPGWWPTFCFSFDAGAGGYLTWLLASGRLKAEARPGLGLASRGNTGGAKVGPFRPMPIPDDLAANIARARTTAGIMLSVVLAVATLFSASACSSPPRDVRMADVDGHQVAYRVLGSGKPVIVMLSGLQHGMATFQDVAPELARSATVIVYDRSGYGGSGIASGPRDAVGAERELSSLLEATGIPGPYVLAGHSIGGLFAEYYAAKHPDQIAGLILEESRPADFARRCEAAGISMCSPLPEMVRGEPRAVQDEVLALPAAEAQVESTGPIKGKPVLVISRPAAVGATSFGTVWTAAQVDLAARYPGALHLVASAGGHDVHNDQRAWYVAAVKEFLRKAN